jgi:hypothetical protein
MATPIAHDGSQLAEVTTSADSTDVIDSTWREIAAWRPDVRSGGWHNRTGHGILLDDGCGNMALPVQACPHQTFPVTDELIARKRAVQMAKLRQLYRRLALLSPVAIFLILWIAYPVSSGFAAHLAFAVLSWIIGILATGFPAAVKFMAVFGAMLLVLTVWCAFRARRAVIAACAGSAGVAWTEAELRRDIGRDTLAVAGAVLIELALPVFIALVLLFLLGEIGIFVSVFIASASASAGLLTQWTEFAEHFTDGGWSEPTWLVNHLETLSRRLWEIAAPNLDKVAASFTAAVGGMASLLIFLFRRRQSNLDAARIVLAEVTALARATMQAVPGVFADMTPLLTFAQGERRMLASTDRELLLLDPGAGQVAKLPACLLEAVVVFMHADLSLNQMWSGLGTQEFADAGENRRRNYLTLLQQGWASEYKPAALSALFRLDLYRRLRAWSI